MGACEGTGALGDEGTHRGLEGVAWETRVGGRRTRPRTRLQARARAIGRLGLARWCLCCGNSLPTHAGRAAGAERARQLHRPSREPTREKNPKSTLRPARTRRPLSLTPYTPVQFSRMLARYCARCSLSCCSVHKRARTHPPAPLPVLVTQRSDPPWLHAFQVTLLWSQSGRSQSLLAELHASLWFRRSLGPLTLATTS